MAHIEPKTVLLSLMVALLAFTSPTWLKPGAQPPVGYDAPWIYPSLNPAVRAGGQDNQAGGVDSRQQLSYNN